MGQSAVLRCACCGFRTGCVTCPICYWTEDGRSDPAARTVVGSRNGELSLTDAQLNYSIYGASAPRYQELVRHPRDDEQP